MQTEFFRFYLFRLKLRLLLKWQKMHADCPYIPPQRYIEFTWTAEAFKKNCKHTPSASLLELGCGNGFFLSYLSGYTNGRVTAIDMDSTLKKAGQFARALGINKPDDTRLFTFSSDASRLPFHDNAFDTLVSVSALEHFSENKDSLAMKEIYRILKTGGSAFITLPVTDIYEETYKKEDVYSTKFKGEPVFFERWYDEKAIQERILTPAPFIVKEKQIFVAEQKKPSLISSLVKVSPLSGHGSHCARASMEGNLISRETPVRGRSCGVPCFAKVSLTPMHVLSSTPCGCGEKNSRLMSRISSLYFRCRK